MKKGLNERNDEDVLRWYGHVEQMEDERIANRVFVGECAESCSLGRPRKRWIDTVKECLKKRGLDVRQERKRVEDRSGWWGNAWGVAQGMNP